MAIDKDPLTLDEQIGSGGKESFPEAFRERIEKAISDLADICDETGKLNNGKTALYWHIVMTVAKHFEEKT